MKKEFTKYLKSLNEAELYAELMKLYTKFPVVKQFYAMELSPNTNKIVEQYRTKIRKIYFKPSGGFGHGSSGDSRNIISNFKKIAIYQSDVIDLWLYRTEMMAEYLVRLGYYNESYFKSVATSFETACKLIVKEKLEMQFEYRCRKIVESLTNCWGLSSEVKWIYERYFGKIEW